MIEYILSVFKCVCVCVCLRVCICLCLCVPACLPCTQMALEELQCLFCCYSLSLRGGACTFPQ